MTMIMDDNDDDNDVGVLRLRQEGWSGESIHTQVPIVCMLILYLDDRRN